VKRKITIDWAHVCSLVLVPGVAAYLFGRPLIFPSIGPSAFALVFDERENGAWRVIGGHLMGVAGGLLAYHALAGGLSLHALDAAASADGLRIVASGVLSIALTAAGMLAARATHAPACATTLIVSLGVLPTLADAALIMLSVTAMFLAHRVVLRIRRGTQGVINRPKEKSP
jgi:hypothetical protein